MFDKQKQDSGVSPVIGVILMVAVTVALVALVTVVVFDIGDDVSEPADITINTDVVDEGDNLEVEVVRNENVDALEATGDVDGDSEIIGDSADIDAGGVGTHTVSLDGPGTVSLEATVGDNEEIVTTVDVPDGSS